MLEGIVYSAIGLITSIILAVLNRRHAISIVWVIFAIGFWFLMWDCWASPEFPGTIGPLMFMGGTLYALILQLRWRYGRPGGRSTDNDSEGE